MPTCDHCGNEYDKTITIRSGEREHVFDCFECAIQMLAPTCETCGVRIIGHGLEANGAFFCCDHCAEKNGVTALRDRV